MKNLLVFVLTFFFFATSFAQVSKPVLDSTANYGYVQLGTRTLVGEKRSYYGSEKRIPKGALSAKPTPADTIPMTIGDVYLVDSVALFWNYGPDGMAHLTELKASDKIYKANGSTYARNCDNLLEIAAYLKTKPASDIGLGTPKKTITREENITFVNNTKVITEGTLYRSPELVAVRVVTVTYHNSCCPGAMGKKATLETWHKQDGDILVLYFTPEELATKQVGVPEYWYPNSTLTCYLIEV